MKLIPLTHGKFAVVDKADFKKLRAFKWRTKREGINKKYIYAVRCSLNYSVSSHGRQIKMHRQILDVTDPKIKVDHKNHNTLDNRRKNLRKTTPSQNLMNRSGAQSNSKSGVRGVYKKPNGRWRAGIRVRGLAIYLGTFKTLKAATRAYAVANRKYFKEFGGNFKKEKR